MMPPLARSTKSDIGAQLAAPLPRLAIAQAGSGASEPHHPCDRLHVGLHISRVGLTIDGID
jgi:hypothetical protein